jgi:hypothetical protein
LTDNPCGSNAECLVSQHLAQCRCIFGYTGDPYQACLPFEPPECVEDKDCPTDQVCINEKCINPCLTLSPCVAPATCKLVDSMPIRTMVCTCPEGYVTDEMEVAEHFPQSFLDVKETMNVMIKQPV